MIRKILIVGCMLLIANLQSTNSFAGPTAEAQKNKKRLLETKRCQNCDLRELNFNRQDLSNVDLQGSDLSKSSFFLANLSAANLKDTILHESRFGGADLADADLTGADLRGASLETAYLEGAKMSGNIVTTRPFTDQGLEDVEKKVYVENQAIPKKAHEYPKKERTGQTGQDQKQTPIKVLPQTPPPKRSAITSKAPQPSTTTQAAQPSAPPPKKGHTINEVILPKNLKTQQGATALKPKQTSAPAAAKLQSGDQKKTMQKPETAVDIREKNKQTLFDTGSCYNCDLSGLDLSERNLKEADLEKANLSNCNLQGTNLKGANLKGAVLTGANLKAANLKNTDLYKADLRQVDLSETNLTGASLDNSLTQGAIGLPSGP
ncbi:MAG: hypothetical protein CSB23_02770 [Deltaproteobacteria bacterium]|nr:MAG: hypothetical protein CSB23_02770 [Deltaproteobacteria bacterium]